MDFEFCQVEGAPTTSARWLAWAPDSTCFAVASGIDVRVYDCSTLAEIALFQAAPPPPTESVDKPKLEIAVSSSTRPFKRSRALPLAVPALELRRETAPRLGDGCS
jgi:hypothetical protein